MSPELEANGTNIGAMRKFRVSRLSNAFNRQSPAFVRPKEPDAGYSARMAGENRSTQGDGQCLAHQPGQLAVQNPAGSGRHQLHRCTINTPLHNKHVFDTYVLAAQRRRRQNEP